MLVEKVPSSWQVIFLVGATFVCAGVAAWLIIAHCAAPHTVPCLW